MPRTTKPGSFVQLLTEQVRHEFTASQQYVAIAVWYDAHDLPPSPRNSTRRASRSATTR